MDVFNDGADRYNAAAEAHQEMLQLFMCIETNILSEQQVEKHNNVKNTTKHKKHKKTLKNKEERGNKNKNTTMQNKIQTKQQKRKTTAKKQRRRNSNINKTTQLERHIHKEKHVTIALRPKRRRSRQSLNWKGKSRRRGRRWRSMIPISRVGTASRT